MQHPNMALDSCENMSWSLSLLYGLIKTLRTTFGLRIFTLSNLAIESATLVILYRDSLNKEDKLLSDALNPLPLIFVSS